MQTVTKRELIERITERSKMNRAVVKKTVQEFLDQIIGELKKGHRLEFRDFGVFEVKERRVRQAQNPKTLERVDVPPKRTVKFKAGRLMRESVEAVREAKGEARSEAKPEVTVVRGKHATQV